MAILVAGPSSVGKSTFIASDEARRRFSLDFSDVVYGFQIAASGVPRGAIIHYNLLRQARAAGTNGDAHTAPSELLDEPALARIILSGTVEHCFVLVAPVDELLDRIEARRSIEPFLANRYPSDIWRDVTSRVDLLSLYSELFDLLDEFGIPCTIIFSSELVPGGFGHCSRGNLENRLAGRFDCNEEMEAASA